MKIWQLSAIQIRDGIREGTFSSLEAVEAHLERIDAVNPVLNAVVNTLEESALPAAAAADRTLSHNASQSLPPLFGVPISVKENIDVVGSPSTLGVPELADNLPENDDAVVRLMKRAGAIPIARTNLPDIGLRWDTDSGLHGRTQNPWKKGVTAGGSSGGEAAAIATGMSPLGLGNDYGGSLRIPAWACGICSLKPGRGRIPGRKWSGPMSITTQAWAVNGPLARSVADLELALDVLSDADPRDPDSVPAPISTQLVPGDTTVAVVEHPSRQATQPAVLSAVHSAASALEDAGYLVKLVNPPRLEELWEHRKNIHGYDVWELSRTDLNELISSDATKFLDDVTSGHREGPTAYHQGLVEILAIRQEWSEFMAQFPLVLGPVSTQPQFASGSDLLGPEAVEKIADSLLLTLAVNNMELPAVAVPTGIDNGLPLGVQVIARRMREEQALAAARAIEERLGTLTPIDPISTK